MSDAKKNKELIERMASMLRDHAEPYREGAWEQFVLKEGKRVNPRRRFLWPYWSAAALLLLASGIFIYQLISPSTGIADFVGLQYERPTTASDLQKQPTTPVSDGEHVAIVGAVGEEILSKQDHQVQETAIVSGNETPYVQNGGMENLKLIKTTAFAGVHFVGTHIMMSKANRQYLPYLSVGKGLLAVVDSPDNSLEEILDEKHANVLTLSAQGAENAYVPVRTTGKGVSLGNWGVGVVVAPSLTNERFNMGGGFSIAYHFSDKLSLNSGAVVSELGLAGQPRPASSAELAFSAVDGDYMSGSKSMNYRELTSFFSNVVTLDIPLDVKYSVTNNLYTSVGVSVLAVLNENRTNHYLDHMSAPTFGKNSALGSNLQKSTEAVYTAEKAPDQPLSSNSNYSGYANFSVGHKLPLFKRMTFAIEPFIKIPIGSLSRQDVDFTHGGIRIVTGF